MRKAFKVAGALAAALMIGSGAQAATVNIDYTENTVSGLTSLGTSYSGTTGSVGWTASSAGRQLYTFSSAAWTALADATAPSLAGNNSGIGVGGLEVDEKEFLTIVFNQVVKLTGFSALLTYALGSNIEVVNVSQGASIGTVLGTATGTQPAASVGYAASGALELVGDTFTFFIDKANNDGRGLADFSLASISLETVPLPAGFLLMGTALGGLGFAARRKKAA